MIDIKGINREPPWKKEQHVYDHLERTIILRCPYATKAIKKKGSFYWCGSPLDKEFFPDGNPGKVKDERIKQMLRIPFDLLANHCFRNFWTCKDHPGYEPVSPKSF